MPYQINGMKVNSTNFWCGQAIKMSSQKWIIIKELGLCLPDELYIVIDLDDCIIDGEI